MPREPRVVTALRVQFPRLGETVVAVTEDISLHGAFLRCDHFLPVGDVLELTIFWPDGSGVLRVISRVAHIMSDKAARALGRRPGMGFEFLEQDPDRRERLETLLQSLIDDLTPPPAELPPATKVLVADPSTRLLERLSTALGDAGFGVELAQNGAEAYSACLNEQPDLVLCADAMPVMDGWTLIKMLAARPRTANLPIALMSDDSSDITRLQAYRLGVKDYIQRPFTDEELCIRLRRLATQPMNKDSVTLRGNLGEIGIGTLLSLLEFERKSGILAVISERHVARLFVASGRVVKVESSAKGDSAKQKLMQVLDWPTGNFEFSSQEVIGTDELQMSTQFILLEHARMRDEVK